MNAELRNKIEVICVSLKSDKSKEVDKKDIYAMTAEIKHLTDLSAKDVSLIEQFYLLTASAALPKQIENTKSAQSIDEKVIIDESVITKSPAHSNLKKSIDENIADLKKCSAALVQLCNKDDIKTHCTPENYVERVKAIQNCFAYIYQNVTALPWGGNDLDRNEIYSCLSALFEIVEDYGWHVLKSHVKSDYERFLRTFEVEDLKHERPSQDALAEINRMEVLISSLFLSRPDHGKAYVKAVRQEYMSNLVVAIKANDKNLVREIVTQNNMSVYQYFESKHLPNEMSFTPLMFAAKFAVDSEMIHTVLFGLSSKEKNLLIKFKIKSQSTFTAYVNWNSLMVAAKWANCAVFKALYMLLPKSKRAEAMNNPFQYDYHYGFTLLVLACSQNSHHPAARADAIDKIEFMVNNGASVNETIIKLISEVALPASGFSAEEKMRLLKLLNDKMLAISAVSSVAAPVVSVEPALAESKAVVSLSSNNSSFFVSNAMLSSQASSLVTLFRPSPPSAREKRLVNPSVEEDVDRYKRARISCEMEEKKEYERKTIKR